METKWRPSFYQRRIIEVAISKETACYVWIASEGRTSKRSRCKDDNYFDTPEEAQKFMLERLRKDAERLRESFAVVEKALVQAEYDLIKADEIEVVPLEVPQHRVEK